jgi:hypothetical protein
MREGFTDKYLNIIHKTGNYQDQYHYQFRMLLFNVKEPTFTRRVAGTVVR